MRGLAKLWALLGARQRRGALLVVLLMLVGMVLETLSVGLIVPAMSLLLQGTFAQDWPVLRSLAASLGNPSHQQVVVGGLLVLVAVYLVKGVFLAFLIWKQASFAFGVQADVSHRLFASYLRRPFAFHLGQNSALLIRNVMGQVNLLTFEGVLPALVLLTESLVALGLCALLLWVEPIGTVLVLGVLGSGALVFHLVTGTRLARWGDAYQVHEGKRIQHLQEGLGAVKEIKLLGRERQFASLYDLHNLQSACIGRLQTTLQQLPRLTLEVLAVASLVLLALSMLARGHPAELMLPTLAMFAAAAFRLTPSVNRMLNALQSLRYGSSVLESLRMELGSADAVHEPAVLPMARLASRIELRDVGYSYPGHDRPALSRVSLEIGKGEAIGIVGPSGAGKSTLVDVILGLLAPQQGEVSVDGMDIRANLRGWQQQVGYVPQAIYLTDDTLRRNVAFGEPDERIDDSAVRSAIRAAQLEDFVASLPEGLDTVLGERGVRLSGGQRQRVGIARALYHDPELLVLDEATSSLDIDTEQEVLDAVVSLRGTKTILIVAHRPSATARCDRRYRVDEGRVREERLEGSTFAIG